MYARTRSLVIKIGDRFLARARSTRRSLPPWKKGTNINLDEREERYRCKHTKRRRTHLCSSALFRRWQTFCFNWKVQYSRHNSLTLHSGSRAGIDISARVLTVSQFSTIPLTRVENLVDNSIKIYRPRRHLRHSIRSIKLL